MEVLARGNYIIKRVDGKRNLLDWQATWREGELPAGWSLNGVAAENSIIVLENPFATKALMWKCTPNAVVGSVNGDSAGGFISPYVKLDNIHTYRYTTFVFREKASKGTIYHGCYNILNLDSAANGNPYFVSNGLPAGQWYLLVGYIHPFKADLSWQMSSAGIYDMSGKKILRGYDYKLQEPNIDIRLRNYLFYTDNPEDIAYFYNPRLECCDGNEPSIEQLLQVSTREEIDAVKVEYKSEIQKLDNKIAFSVSEVKTYADGKATSEASKAVDSVRVGGRNYIIASKLYSYLPYNTAPTYADGIITTKIVGTNGMFTIAINGFTPIYTETYTVSGVMKKNGNVVTNADWKNKAANTYLTPLKFKVDDSTGRFEITSYYNTNEGSRKWILHTGLNVVANDIITIEFLKFESGNKATDWSPAPEDVEADAQAKADAARVAAEAVAVAKAELAKTTAQAYADGKVTAEEQRAIADAQAKLNEAKADAQAKANAAQSAATAAAAADATNKVNTLKQETNAQLTILSDQIASKVSTATFNALGNRVTAAESTITQHSNQIALKASQSDLTALGNRVSSAEAKITPDAIKLTVRSQTEQIVADSSKRTEVTVDGTGLDPNKYYPITIQLRSDTLQTITVERPLSPSYGVPAYATHSSGFSMACKWSSNGAGWGATPISRTVHTLFYRFVDSSPCGSIGQLDYSSQEYIYVRGGSKYRVLIEGAINIPVILRTENYTWTTSTGTYPQTINVLDSIIVPEITYKTKSDIQAGISIVAGGISVFGQELSLAGKVTFASFASDAQSKVNTAQSTANSAVTKADAAQSTANSAVSKADTAQSGLNTLIGKLGDMSYLDMVSLAKLDTTIIEGGFIKTNLIDANAIITNSLLAQKIAATDITTSRLTATDGAKIGEFVIENGNLICSKNFPLTPTKVMSINMDSIRFVEKRYTDQQIVRTIAVGTSTLSTATGIKPLLTILDEEGQSANVGMYINVSRQNKYTGGNIAIMAHGGAHWVQGADDKWKMPGVVWAGRVSANGGVQNYWGDGCYVSSANATAVGWYDIYHDLKHTDYFVIVTPTPYTTEGDRVMTAMVASKYSNYFSVVLADDTGRNRRCAFEIAIIGRNTL